MENIYVMNKLYNVLGIALLSVMVFSSCSKKKYTASFAPSKQRSAMVKVETPAPVIENEMASLPEVVAGTGQVIAEVSPAPIMELTTESLKQQLAEAPAFTKQEQKAVKKQVRKIVMKKVKNQMFHKNSSDVKASDNQVVALIVAIFIPPLGVWIHQRDITLDFWLSLLLWILGWVPGIVYAWLVILDIFSAEK